MVPSHPEAVRNLHAWGTDFDKSLKRSVFIAYELNSPWDPSICSVFSKNDAPRSTLNTLIELPAFIVNPSRRPVPPPPQWSWRYISVLLPQPPSWPDWDASWGECSLDRVEFLPPVGNDGDITPVLIIFLCLSLLECSCFLYCVFFSITSVIFGNQTFVKSINRHHTSFI